MAHIDIRPHDGPVAITWRGHTIVSTNAALDLVEGAGRPVLYVPRADADMTFFEKTSRSSHCLHKGAASYLSLHDASGRAENAVWSYEAPKDAASAIAGYLAFYPDQVTFEPVR